MTGWPTFFALYVSVRLPEQPSGSRDLQAAPIVKTYSFVFCFSQGLKCLGILVFFSFLKFDRLVQLLVFAMHVFPFSSPDAFVDGLTNGMPVLIHERKPTHLLSPTSEVSMKVRNIPCPSLRSVNSSAPSRTTAAKKICREIRLHHLPRLHVFCSKSPTFTGSWLSIVVNLLSPSTTLSRLFSRKPCTTMLTGLSPSFCWFAKSLSALIKVSQTPFSGACAQGAFGSRPSVLSCMTKILFGAFTLSTT